MTRGSARMGLWTIGLLLLAGCTGLDDSGLGSDMEMDAGSDSAAALDAAWQDDTAEPTPTDTGPGTVDSSAPSDTSADVAAETDAPDAPDAPLPIGCDKDDPNLVACYKFEVDERPTQPWDQSSWGNHGTATGASFELGPPGQGKAIVVTSASRVKVPDSTSLRTFSRITIEAWIKPKSIPGSGRAGIVDENGVFGVFLHPGGVIRATAPTALDSPAVIKTGTWQHVAYTYDGAEQVLYLDGVVVANKALAAGTFGTGNGDGLAIGMNSPDGDNFDGSIDTLKIWRVARTAAQICKAAGAC